MFNNNCSKNLRIAAICTLVAFVAGCSTTDTARTATPSSTASSSSTSGGSDSATSRSAQSTSASQGSAGFNQSTSYFPTGMREGSALEVTKIAPNETIVGQPLTYHLEMTNITNAPIENVLVKDAISENFELTSAYPEPKLTEGNILAWHHDSIAPGETVKISVTGSTSEQGIVEHCATASFTPVLCAETRVVNAAIAIEKSLPATVLACDPIPMQIVVRNDGSSQLSGVKISDTLPSGLTTADGATYYNQDVGDLGAGQSRQFSVNLMAARVGTYANTAQVTSSQGIGAEDAAEVTVVKPVLSLDCEAPEELFAGRPISVCLTAGNPGEVSATDVQVVLDIPQGTTFRSATQGGAQQGDTVVWNVSNLAPNATREFCATLVSNVQGAQSFFSVVRGYCVDEVRSICSTMVSGIPALLLEVIDVEDPIEVGATETYEITVTNQGSAPATDVEVRFWLEDAQSFVGITGSSRGSESGGVITVDKIPSLPAGEQVAWIVTVKAEEAGDIRFRAAMNSAEMGRPVDETESTYQY